MYAGNVFVVDHLLTVCKVIRQLHHTINGVLPDTPGTQVESPLRSQLTVISVVDNTSFLSFEGITTSTGYAYVGGEVIEYVDNGDGTLGITSRGVDDTVINIHDQGDIIYKYEMSGVSLRRINKEHKLPDDDLLNNSRDINTLPLTFERTGRLGGPTQINFNQEQQAGGNSAVASQNFQYTSVFPSLVF